MYLINLVFLFVYFKQITCLKFNNNILFKNDNKNNNLFFFQLRNNPDFYPKVIRPWNGHNIEALIFEGGGARAVVYCGVIQCLEEKKMLSKISLFSGTSSGSQIASLLAFGYSSKEIKKIFKLSPWDEILDRTFNFNSFKDIYQLTQEYGLYSGQKLEKFYDDLFRDKIGFSNCTFMDLYNQFGTHLKVERDLYFSLYLELFYFSHSYYYLVLLAMVTYDYTSK